MNLQPITDRVIVINHAVSSYFEAYPNETPDPWKD